MKYQQSLHQEGDKDVWNTTTYPNYNLLSDCGKDKWLFVLGWGQDYGIIRNSKFLPYWYYSRLSGPTIGVFLYLSPLHLCSSTGSFIPCILRVLVIWPPQIKCVSLTRISPTSPNIMLLVNLMVSLIHTHSRSLKQIFYFYPIINYYPCTSWIFLLVNIIYSSVIPNFQ